MKIAYQIRAKNGYLWQAVEKLGSVKSLSTHLGIPYARMCNFINMRDYPSFRNKNSKWDWISIETKLLELTGCLLEEIFPKEMATSEFMISPRSHTVVAEVSFEQLTSKHNDIPIEASQDKALSRSIINGVLMTLRPREQKILRMYFGLQDHDGSTYSIDEIALIFNVSRSRICQIKMQALRKMRFPARRQLLDCALPVERSENPIDIR